MKKNVITFGPHDSIFDVAEIFSQHNISGAPVVDGKKLIGMITEGDLMKFMSLSLPESELASHEPHSLSLLVAGMVKESIDFLRELKKISKSKVKDYMTSEVVSIPADAMILEAAKLMDKEKINRLPVIERDKLVGIISRSDLLRALLDE